MAAEERRGHRAGGRLERQQREERAGPPSTSASPTTPLTASVTTAVATKMAPGEPRRHAVAVQLEDEHHDERAVQTPWRSTFDPVCGKALCSRSAEPHKARQMMSGSGRYEPMVRSGVRPQKSRLKASSHPMLVVGLRHRAHVWVGEERLLLVEDEVRPGRAREEDHRQEAQRDHRRERTSGPRR